MGEIALGACIVIAWLATAQWYRHRVRGSGWAALAFSLLGAVLLVGKVQTVLHPAAFSSPWFTASLAGAVLVVPYLLFSFAATFRPPPAWLRITAVVLTVAAVLSAMGRDLPSVQLSPWAQTASRWVIVGQLALLFSFVVVRLWSYGRGRSTVATQRMRMLALATAGIELVVLAGAVGLSSHRHVAWAVDATSVVVGVLVTLALPSFAQSWGNKRDNEAFQRAVADLVTAETAEEVSSGMLPHICALVGASSAAVVDEDGDVIAHYATRSGSSVLPSEPDKTINVTSRFGPAHHLVVTVEPHMVYFGRGEMQRLEELADLGALATERCDAKAALTHQTLHDSLTGLPNRDLFVDRLTQALAVLERHHTKLAVMFIDLDRFKLINDRINHAAGDTVLVEVATRLALAVRDGDTVARIGGDEFVAVLEIDNEEEALQIADRMREGIGASIDVGDREVSVTASIGLVVTSERGADPLSLLRDADAAMYLAKEAGRDHVQLFNEHIRASSLQRIDLEHELLIAIGEGQLVLHYQPVFRLSDGVGVGVEALVRWEHPTRGLLPPDEFIQLAEDSGLIIQLSAWVLTEACQQATEWLKVMPGDYPFTMWVNQSAHQFHRTDVVAGMLEVLNQAGLDPRRLGVEITETVFMSDKERLRTTMSDLNWNGVSIAIDDFGTGFSSLSYLKRFPVDILKVDRSFVQGIGQEPETSLVAACLSLARALDIHTVAEGVETAEQADWLTRAGCDHVQGYGFCRPVTADEALKVLIASRRAPQRRSRTAAYRALTKKTIAEPVAAG